MLYMDFQIGWNLSSQRSKLCEEDTTQLVHLFTADSSA